MNSRNLGGAGMNDSIRVIFKPDVPEQLKKGGDDDVEEIDSNEGDYRANKAK